MNNNELYHSSIYLGQDYSDGIRHFKYIKREKKNGRWVYYYKDDNLNNLKKEQKRNLDALQAENKKRGYGNNNYAHIMVKGKKINDKVYNKLTDDAVRSSYAYANEKYKSDKRKKKYEAVPIKALNTLSMASHTVKKNVEKGKKKIAKLFKKKK